MEKNEGNPQEKSVSLPFVNLEKSKDVVGKNALFYDVPGHPEIVVRKCFTPKEVVESINDELKKSELYKDCTEEELEEIRNKKKVEQLIKNGRDFRLVEKDYGIKVADTTYVIAKNPESGNRDIFAVTERIEGKNLVNMTDFSEKIKEELDEMYSSLLFYLSNSYLTKGVFWRDFRCDQVMCGNKYGETEQHLYLIDVDPLMRSWTDERLFKTEEDQEDMFWVKIYFFLCEIEEFERKASSKIFLKTRETLNSIINTIPEPKGERGKEWYSSVLYEMEK